MLEFRYKSFALRIISHRLSESLHSHSLLYREVEKGQT
jgi:hypothetical protein